MIATYHNHSTWSDGKASVAELCAGAVALGVDELGISDHLVVPPAGPTPRWSMDAARLGDYVDDVRAAGGGRLTVRLGLEVDWYPGHGVVLSRALAAHRFDYLIGSVHHVGDFVVDASAARWDALDPADRERVHRDYWTRVASLAESGLFDVVAHLDLTKKFGHRPAREPTREIDAALDAIAAADLVVELNTAGWHKPCGDAYPSTSLLERCRARGIAVTVSADAHEPGHLLRDFGRGLERLAAAGFDEVARFEGRRRTMEGIVDAQQSLGRKGLRE